MSVKGKNFKIKNAQINPNITSDGLIFHIDPVYSEKSETNYLYNTPALTGESDNFSNFSNLISDGSTPYVISGTYTQTNKQLTIYSSSVTYSFGVGSFNNASGFLTTGDKNSVYSIFEFGGTATPGTNLKLTMWGLTGSTEKTFNVFGTGGYTFSSTQSGSTLLTTLTNNFIELPSGFTAGYNIFTTDSKFLSFVTSTDDGWKYEGKSSYLTSNSLGSGGFTFSWVNSFTWSSGIIGSYSSTQSVDSVWIKSSNKDSTILPKIYDENLFYYFDNNNYTVYDYQDKAFFTLADKEDLYRPNPISMVDEIGISQDPIYHDDDLNLLFIGGSTRTNTGTYSYISENDEAILLVYDTNIDRLTATISFGVTSSAGPIEIVAISGDIYCFAADSLYYINKYNLTANLLMNNISNYLDFSLNDYNTLRPFIFNNKKYILGSINGSTIYYNTPQVHIYQVSTTTASVYTFSVPESYNGYGLTNSDNQYNISDVDVYQPVTGASWSRLYIPVIGSTFSGVKDSLIFVYQLQELSGNISVDTTPIRVLGVSNSVVNRVYKVPDVQEKFWSVVLPASNRDRLYLFGSNYDFGEWSVTSINATVSTSNLLFGVSQSQVSQSQFMSGLNYDFYFYTGSVGNPDRATYSGTWQWDSGAVGNPPTNPGTGEFGSMTSSFSGNSFFRIHRQSIIGTNDIGGLILATFSDFTQIVSAFTASKPVTLKISSNPNNYWTVRKNIPIDTTGSTFVSPYVEYITNYSPRSGQDNLGWKSFGTWNNFFYNWNTGSTLNPEIVNYIRNSTTSNIDKIFTYDSSVLPGRFFGGTDEINGVQVNSNSNVRNWCYNTNKNVYYTIKSTGGYQNISPGLVSDPDYYYILEMRGHASAANGIGNFSLISLTTKIGYISLPNFGWQGFSNSGLRNKKVIDRIAPVWDEGTISIWFHPRDIIGTASTFQSLFSCWEPIKKNQGTSIVTSPAKTLTQFSENTEFFFGLGNFNGNDSTLTVKTRNKITYYKPVIDGSFNFTKKWFNITVSRSSTGLKVYLNGERLSTFSGDLESIHSTSTFINISGVDEKNSFFLNRRDSRVIVGGYRQFSNAYGSNGLTTSIYYHGGPIGLFNGFFSTVLIWRKELSNSEVKQNFNSLKSRFGL
jgi:hypothetical protein